MVDLMAQKKPARCLRCDWTVAEAKKRSIGVSRSLSGRGPSLHPGADPTGSAPSSGRSCADRPEEGLKTMKHKHKWEVENVMLGNMLAALKLCRRCRTVKAPVDSGRPAYYVIQGSKAEDARRRGIRGGS